MIFWPQKKRDLKKVIIIIFMLLVIAFSLIAVLFKRFKNLAQFPPCDNLSTLHLDSQVLTCPQRVDETGWIVENAQVKVFPHCLTVMNSRFGSRFNLDWYFSNQKVTSSTIGTFADYDVNLNLVVQEPDKAEQLFPLSANSDFPRQSVDLGLTYEKINFESEDLLLSFNIVSPFSPSQSSRDDNTKLSTAPFFYLELSLVNKTPLSQVKNISLSLGNAREIKDKKDYSVAYFNDYAREDGQLALASSRKQTDIASFINNNRGGFIWKVNLKPYSQDTVRFIYAGYLEGTSLTDSRQEKKRELKFAYQQWFNNIDSVINFALDHEPEIEDKRNKFEQNAKKLSKSPKMYWLLAQSFHSYIGNTWLVFDKEKDDLEYYVWEGEFKYLNTLDVAHDYGVLEGIYFPWVLKAELKSWQKSAKKDEKGTVIPHDLGSRFVIKSSQAYGIDGWETSGMPVEENANFILLTYWYWHQTKDHQFIREITPFLKELINSLMARDGNQNGLADQLIRMTTYDNDGNSALKEAPDGTYLGLKQLAAYLSVEKIFQFLKEDEYQKIVNEEAKLIVQSLEKAQSTYGFIPLTIDPSFQEKNQFNNRTVLGTEEQGFVFISGLFYHALTNFDHPLLKEIIPLLSKNYPTAYQKSLVKNESDEIIGLRLAENQDLALGWFSHSVIADYIAKKLFNQNYQSTEIFFPLLYDNPFSFADGQFFKKPFYPPQNTLVFYPRGVSLFAYLKE
ncbi:MAG TPA: glycoside hydrolase family 52 protein [Candidatus Bathyarchaeia archaeon]|nr:glycoside hydrolase family 52 protein [Candidatus Bathyarchaeia archaeon]